MPGLLVFIGSPGALGVLVLVVYDTALLYNLGRLGDRLPIAAVALCVLVGLRRVASRGAMCSASRPSGPSGPMPVFVRYAVSWWLVPFFVPALAVRYGVMFGTPLLAAGLVC